jgi:hypothetical protein
MPSHPRPGLTKKKDVDARDGTEHDDVDGSEYNKFILFYDIASLTSSSAASASNSSEASP